MLSRLTVFFSSLFGSHNESKPVVQQEQTQSVVSEPLTTSMPSGTEAPPLTGTLVAESGQPPAWLALCVPLTQRFEGCQLTAYPDPATGAAPWTCGWGSTGVDVTPATAWTQEQADNRLRADLEHFAGSVDTLVKVPLAPNQKAALVDFTYNLGAGNLASSTLLKLLNAGDYRGAAAQFPLWNKAAGKVMAGLVRRRAAEQSMFETGRWDA